MDAKTWNEAAYASQGFGAQRLYPNEELLRFMGRNFFGTPRSQRGAIKILEAGCGSGSNLWMIAREGFDAYGIDFSPAAIGHCQAMMEKWNTRATLRVGDMTAMPFPDASFDAVLDVFSAYSLTETQFDAFLSEAARVLKPGGRFFSYSPSKASDAFRNPGDVARIDGSTVAGIRREGAPYSGSDHPFRFITTDEYEGGLRAHSFTVAHMERVSRTYRHCAEYFEFIVVEAIRTNTP